MEETIKKPVELAFTFAGEFAAISGIPLPLILPWKAAR